MRRDGAKRDSSARGPAWMLFTNLAVGLAMRRSFVRLPLDGLVVGSFPLENSPAAVGLDLVLDGLVYRVRAGGRDLAPLASATTIWVAGKQALTDEIGSRGSLSS